VPKRPAYDASEDLTFTESQAKRRAFRLGLEKGGDPRHPSTETIHKYSTGYHESSLTTDTIEYLRQAKDNNNGSHTLANVPSGSYKGYGGQKVYSSTLSTLLKYADGFRTDTAQTIMSGLEGKGAGHSGSEVNTKGQSAAHNLLRAKIVEILQLDPKKTKGLTERSLLVFQGAVTVASMAPGQIARTVKGGTASLKGGKRAQENWEPNRNEAKRRVDETFDALDSDEQGFVRSHAASFLDSTQLGVTAGQRVLSLKRPTSPIRGQALVSGEVSGGDYLTGATAPTLRATKKPPVSAAEMGTYMTEPFRAQRRLAIAS
jgi:hypothetical protein